MNIIEQDRLVQGLLKIKRTLCSYDAFGANFSREEDRNVESVLRHRCDCKYGATQVGSKHEEGCGCPEVAAAMTLIALLTPAEFERMVKRQYNRRHKSRFLTLFKGATK